MSGPHGRLTPTVVRDEIDRRLTDPHKLAEWLREQLPYITGPTIDAFDPPAGYPGCLVTITGSNFSEVRADNEVEVGGVSAVVVAATPTELRVLTDATVQDGPVSVTIAGQSATAPYDFRILPYPRIGRGHDGPPIAFAGSGGGSAGDVNPIGTVRVLVALVRPSDRVPANAATARSAVVTAWGNVEKFYEQASYNRTNVQNTVTANWAVLDGTAADFLAGDNIDPTQLDRITAQAAQAAVNEGHNLDDFDMMACVLFLDNTFIRCWGGWSQQNFSYSNGKPVGDPARIAINLTANHDINLMALNETANWGRCAHEFGHNVVSAPSFQGDGTATLGEDVYSSDLIDPLAATARAFDLMGSHDMHPLFSGYHLEKLGYFDPANILDLAWSRNPYSGDFEIVAHGLVEDTAANRVHLLKITVAQGLCYYVQVRQRPGTTAQVFDDSIPLGGAPNDGGVIVTRVIGDTLQMNQQTRFIALAHDERVLKAGDVVEDPARTIRITVLDDNVQARPLVARVRVEWGQTVQDNPNGTFDLNVEPWNNTWTTPDLWIDRAPWDVFDNPDDAQGRPIGNGDRPQVDQINHLIARVHVSGAMGASDVQTTFYAVFPPGVGDNGNWAPIGTKTIATIPANSYADTQPLNWVPVVGKHTCLKVFAEGLIGEISAGNNSAQENVCDFEAASSSPAMPVFIPTAVRNPIDEPRLIRMRVHGVPEGWRVYFPHSWLWLEGKAERDLELVVIPENSWAQFHERRLPLTAEIRIDGYVTREYDSPLDPNGEPAGSRHYPIGGVLDRVHVRRQTEIDLRENRELAGHDEWVLGLAGSIDPAAGDQKIRVEVTDPDGGIRVSECRTDPQGRYSTAIDLQSAPSIDLTRPWQPGDPPLRGTYSACAWIFDASEATTARSKTIYIRR